MASSTAIGTKAETEVVKALHRAGLFKAKREPKGGAKDKSDVHLPASQYFVIEVKAGKQTKSGTMSQTPSWGQIKGWWEEAVVECQNVVAAYKDDYYDIDEDFVPLLVIRRWGSGKAEDWWCYFHDGTYLLSARFGDVIDNIAKYE